MRRWGVRSRSSSASTRPRGSSGADGETIEIPQSAFHALKLVVAALARGQIVALVPHGRELTTQQAADLLHVSRPHLVKLLAEGVIPHHKVGTHRRVRIEDALANREQRAATRREQLDELARLSEELEGGHRQSAFPEAERVREDMLYGPRPEMIEQLAPGEIAGNSWTSRMRASPSPATPKGRSSRNPSSAT